jgi:hypothetical protein
MAAIKPSRNVTLNAPLRPGSKTEAIVTSSGIGCGTVYGSRGPCLSDAGLDAFMAGNASKGRAGNERGNG